MEIVRDNSVGTDAWKEEVQKKVMADREEQRKKRFEDLAKYYDSKMNTLMDTYFSIYSDVEGENESTFNILNKEWMSFAQKANQTQKIINVNSDRFAKNVKFVVESENFKNRNKAVEEVAPLNADLKNLAPTEGNAAQIQEEAEEFKNEML